MDGSTAEVGPGPAAKVPAPSVPAAAAMTALTQSRAHRPDRAFIAFVKIMGVRRYPWRRGPPKRPTGISIAAGWIPVQPALPRNTSSIRLWREYDATSVAYPRQFSEICRFPAEKGMKRGRCHEIR